MASILLITYDISPYRGSEASVSWNYVRNMSKTNRILVLFAYGNEEIISYSKNHHLENVIFINIPSSLPHGNGLIKDIIYNLNYRKWHYKVYLKAKSLLVDEHIDIIHYLNPIGFKEPGFLWKIKNKPYVWGPMKAVDNRPIQLYRALSIKGKINSLFRLIFHNAAFILLPRVRKAINRADVIFSAVPRTSYMLTQYYHKDSIYLPENGIQEQIINKPINYTQSETLNIIWIGRLDENKALIILIDALKKVKNKNWHLHVIGSGVLETKLKKASNELNSSISWYGNIPRSNVMELLPKMHIHVITSLGEATTTVLFEAMSYAIPTITLDHCGMSGVVCNKCGIKIPIGSYKQVTQDIATAIDNLITQPEKVKILSKGVIECSKKYKWENRIDIFNNIYTQLTGKYQNK